MRKNTARHWLHAALDLLPVLLIPVFMIYSHRHTLTEQTQVDIQYKYESNEVNNIDDLVDGNIYNFNNLTINVQDFHDYSDFTINILQVQDILDFDWEALDETYLLDYDSRYNNRISLYVNYNGEGYLSYTNEDVYDSWEIVFEEITLQNCIGYSDDYGFLKVDHHYYHSSYLPQYTDFNVIESVDVQDSNSSVMNVFMDNFNTAVDKYFNMGNVFNMNNVYQWFNTNIFGGNAPVVIYSVWNIVLYEFVMDLLFLLYGLFMWFIDMCKRLMEKPLDSIK